MPIDRASPRPGSTVAEIAQQHAQRAERRARILGRPDEPADGHQAVDPEVRQVEERGQDGVATSSSANPALAGSPATLTWSSTGSGPPGRISPDDPVEPAREVDGSD